MAKRIKKPPIKPEIRRDWLKRNEGDGESPPQIAEKDKFDVRTVRKQIELAKQERENREARSIVLRDALEKHYDDLRRYAEKLNSDISGTMSLTSSPDDDFILAALRQHLPRSPIWSDMPKWQNINRKYDEQLQEIGRMMEQTANKHPKLKPLNTNGFDVTIANMGKALSAQADQWSHGNSGLDTKVNLLLEPAGEGFMSLRYGGWQMGRTEKENAERYKKIIGEALDELGSGLKSSETYQDLEKTVAETRRLVNKLREELAIIRLRRIVPGRCKYCPI